MASSIQLLWKHFYRNDQYYKTDHTHKAAWCNSCLNGHMLALRESDARAARAGQVLAVRTEEVLRNSGLSFDHR
ncbi:hypothetical protein GALMADRAFT_255975 [Galerina marginata CBS 339.88]|uniref:Uncharacterized protein n=1 Tax=Galerina marginata (strain CBS 339.88) TaxID=685588 RepID=A0A067SRU3_GALM3|nr:hypothetical protein GALMADRAFT_255975 [Galerina marginata CBS 339.88]